MPSRSLKEPTPKLKPGIIYEADNGRLICLRCAGMSAKYTGRDISGQRVRKIDLSEDTSWVAEFGTHLACEAGCTSYDSSGSVRLLNSSQPN